jgi:hypothetical protein
MALVAYGGFCMAQTESLLDQLARPASLFTLAFSVRLLYLTIIGTDSAALSHPDSSIFVGIASSADWWRGTPDRMPVYPIFLHIHFVVFGAASLWAPIVTQMAVDALACVAISRIAEAICPGSGRWAGLLAAFNPTQIVLAGALLGDSLFVSCLVGGFLALARWSRGDSSPVAIGIWLGVALLNRALIWPFLPVIGLAIAARASGIDRIRAPIIVLLVVGLFAAPIIVRNWAETGSAALTSQGGVHMAFWLYPLAREAADGTPYAVSVAAARERFEALGGARPEITAFEASSLYSQVAREGLRDVGLVGIAKSWVVGALINLASPATQMIPAIMALPRTGFYDTVGASPLEKIKNFVFNSSGRDYVAWICAGIAIEWPIRLVALLGFLIALRAPTMRTAAIFALLWAGYILAVQGPVASAKYRLPIEPFAMVFVGVAILRFERRNATRALE